MKKTQIQKGSSNIYFATPKNFRTFVFELKNYSKNEEYHRSLLVANPLPIQLFLMRKLLINNMINLKHNYVSKSYPLPPKTIRGYDCRKMAYF
nr:MAG TPA: hypothetical protein [Caudoviricetes sp.]